MTALLRITSSLHFSSLAVAAFPCCVAVFRLEELRVFEGVVRVDVPNFALRNAIDSGFQLRYKLDIWVLFLARILLCDACGPLLGALLLFRNLLSL